MKKIPFIIIPIIGMCFGCNQVDVNLKTQTQTTDSLIVSITYTNNSSKRIVLDGFSYISFEDYIPTRAQMYDSNNEDEVSKMQIIKEGDANDTIILIIPETKENLRYQRLNNGDTLDVFYKYSVLRFSDSCPIVPPEPTKDMLSECFNDKSVFKLLWDNDAWSSNEFFDNENTYYDDYWDLIILEPHSSKSVSINLSYLLKRKASYILQIIGKGPIRKGFDAKMIIKKKFGYKPYNKPFKSNTISIIVSD